MNKAGSFFKGLETAHINSTNFNLDDIARLSFKDYSPAENERLKAVIDHWFYHTIKARDESGFPREITVDDCSGMAVSLYYFLKKQNVPCHIVIGDMRVYGELDYNTTYQYLEEILGGKEHQTIDYHVWVVIENFWIVDPTFRLKESEKESFIAGETNAGVFIVDIESMPDGLEYIPMLVGVELLAKTNQVDLAIYENA